jgi:hypothetical protein
VVRTLKAELSSKEPPPKEAPPVQVPTACDISSDTTTELAQVKHMQPASDTGVVIERHQRLENWTAALLTALAAHAEREEYAGSSVMIAVCCEEERLTKLMRAKRRDLTSSAIVSFLYLPSFVEKRGRSSFPALERIFKPFSQVALWRSA